MVLFVAMALVLLLGAARAGLTRDTNHIRKSRALLSSSTTVVIELQIV